MTVALGLALVSLAAWLYLLLGRGFFWWPALPDRAPPPQHWPHVAIVVPARNEADVVGECVASLLTQDYPGPLSLVLVDDHSDDGTAEVARAAADAAGASGRLRIVGARALPAGWTGKLWALSEGVRQLDLADERPDLYLFTDADIRHHKSNLTELVSRLEAEQRDLVSLMVLLRCQSFAERLLIPAFVFFFAMLYPFAWVNDPRRRTAAAAGGAILLRRGVYERIGGLAAIRGALIDDCALARAVKRSGGALWLGLSRATVSLRPYPRLGDIWRMVARTAYTELDHSPARLAAAGLGLALTYLAPPLLLFAGGVPAALGIAAWVAMTVAYAPILRFYAVSILWAPALPAVAAVYLGATLDSARRHWLGVGGQWKGRVQWQSQR